MFTIETLTAEIAELEKEKAYWAVQIEQAKAGFNQAQGAIMHAKRQLQQLWNVDAQGHSDEGSQ